MGSPVLMGLDPGSLRMGFTVGTGEQLPLCSAWRFDQVGEDLGEMLVALDAKLNAAITEHAVEEVCYEAPILLRHDTLGRLRKTLNLGGHIEFVCRTRGVAYSEVSLQDVKAELAGMRSADKNQMVAAAEKLGVTLPLTKAAGREDAADSLGVFLLLLRSRSPKLSYEFDRRLWGVRGGLAL